MRKMGVSGRFWKKTDASLDIRTGEQKNDSGII